MVWPIFTLGAVILFMSFVFAPKMVSLALQMAFFLAPVWLPALLIQTASTLWFTLKRSEYIASQKYILLELRPPRGHEKTPLAMEAVLSGLHLAPGESTWYKKFIKGAVRPYWSLEIVSLEGQVHFYIWTRAGFRRLIEAQVYAQYPGAQVVEAQDYTKLISAKPDEWQIWGCDFTKTKPDPYPIKTYVEYGLDKVQKEPEQVDPLASLTEFMGSMRKGEYIWLQFIVRVHKGDKYHGKHNARGDHFTWKDEAAEIVSKIREETRSPFVNPETGVEVPGFPNPTKGQSETMAAIERNVSKLGFDVGIRGVYIATEQSFDGINISGLLGIFKQFSSEGWNSFKPIRGMTIFDDYPWEYGVGKLKDKVRKELVQAFRRRQFFFEPYRFDGAVMSTEELATIYHVPSRAVETPSLPRVQSSTGEAPFNLPI